MDARHDDIVESTRRAAPRPPVFPTLAQERQHRKERLAAGFRLFARFGFDEGVAGHITARDPEFPDSYWVNPFGMTFAHIRASDLVRVDHSGQVVEGDHPVNPAAIAIHQRVHAARPDAVGVAHSHSLYGRAFSTLGRNLDAITQDSCAFYNDHALYADYGGVAEGDEGERIARALGAQKAAILQNHGLITVGETVDAAVWWFITLERSCQVQLLAEAAAARTGQPLKTISETAAKQAYAVLGGPGAGWFQFQTLYAKIVRDQPDLLD
ncbi:class II aldolase/adducin family protein [Phenylobacterium sp.]|uniref:class II aldolase/adducin family protein n=1 Tax=Phenylobacterium sp. TaxID=1871053 RepID=UPI002ED867F9